MKSEAENKNYYIIVGNELYDPAGTVDRYGECRGLEIEDIDFMDKETAECVFEELDPEENGETFYLYGEGRVLDYKQPAPRYWYNEEDL